MALCIECSPAVQEVPGSIPDCNAFIALVKPLHSDDPNVMHFSHSLLRFERLAPSRAIWTSTRPIKYIRVRVKLSHDPQSRACDITVWGGAVVVQAEVLNSSQ
jgi:hypothetical protein